MVWAIAIVCAASALAGGAYWWGIERGRSEWRFAAARRGADLRVFRDTGSALLRELITKEMSLREPGLTDWEVVNRLRDWSHANTDVSTEGYLLDKDTSFAFYNRSAAEIFAAFLQDRGGVWCGGAAYALMEVYRLFGFQASFLDYGKPGVMTHVVTLVKVMHDGTQRTTIQDPTLNIAYAATDGTPYDYFELLTALLQHQAGRIRMLHGSREGGDALVYPGEGGPSFDHVIDPGARPIQVFENGVRKYKSRLSWESFERRSGKSIRAFLKRQGHPENPLYLFLYPLAGSDQSIVEQARQLTGRRTVQPPK